MTVLQIIAKVIFLPYYILTLCLATIIFLFGLAINGQITFKECLEVWGTDTYWDIY